MFDLNQIKLIINDVFLLIYEGLYVVQGELQRRDEDAKEKP